jgi:hypothetical protein
MSLSRAYHPLLTVAVEDDSTHNRLSGLALLPTGACEDNLADHQLVFRPREGGAQIFYQTNPAAAEPLLGRIDGRTRFSFALVQSGQNLLERYLPDLTADTGPQLHLHNLTPSGNIQTKNTLSIGTSVQRADAIRIYPPIFVVPVDLSGGPTVVRIHDRFNAGTILRQVPIAAAAGSSRALTKIDLSDLPSGPYLLDTEAAGSVARAIYVDRKLGARPALGVVELYQEASQDTVLADGASYFIRFQPR